MGDTLLVIEVHLVSRAEDAEMMMHNIPKIRRNLMLLLLLLDGFKLKKCSEGVIFNMQPSQVQQYCNILFYKISIF